MPPGRHWWCRDAGRALGRLPRRLPQRLTLPHSESPIAARLIGDLTVGFPRDKVFFGNVPPVATTVSLTVPAGVPRTVRFGSALTKTGITQCPRPTGSVKDRCEGQQPFTYTSECCRGAPYAPRAPNCQCETREVARPAKPPALDATTGGGQGRGSGGDPATRAAARRCVCSISPGLVIPRAATTLASVASTSTECRSSSS